MFFAPCPSPSLLGALVCGEARRRQAGQCGAQTAGTSGGQQSRHSVPVVSIYLYFLTIPLNCQRKPCLSWHRTGVQLVFGDLEVWERKDDNFIPNGKLVAGGASFTGNLCQIVCQLDSEVPSPRAGALASLAKEPACLIPHCGAGSMPPPGCLTP